jgi:hypothetical protein
VFHYAVDAGQSVVVRVQHGLHYYTVITVGFVSFQKGLYKDRFTLYTGCIKKKANESNFSALLYLNYSTYMNETFFIFGKIRLLAVE